MADLPPNAQNIANLLKSILNKKASLQNKERQFDGFFDTSKLAKAAQAYNDTWYYEFSWQVSSKRKSTGKLMNFLQKVLRKIFRFLFQPLFAEQIKFNSSMTWAMNEVIKNLECINEEIVALKCQETDQVSAEKMLK